MEGILKQLTPAFADNNWQDFVDWLQEQDFTIQIKLAMYMRQCEGHMYPDNEDNDWMEDAKEVLSFIEECKKP